MRKWTPLPVVALAVCGSLLGTPESAVGQAVSPALEPAAWLAGCWRLERGSVVIDEQWMAPRGDAMVGMARTVRAGAMRGFELVRIVVRDGQLVYVADPSGQSRTEFPATLVEADRQCREQQPDRWRQRHRRPRT